MTGAVEGEGVARVSTLWHPNGTRVCYPATEQAQQLGTTLAQLVVEAWREQ